MALYSIKAWTGPCGVNEVCDRMRNLGFPFVKAGTEHVYLYYSGDNAPSAARNLQREVRNQRAGLDWLEFKPAHDSQVEVA